MGIQTSFHAALGAEFLGLRLSRRGDVQVVYDDGIRQNGVTGRHIWRVQGTGGETLSAGQELALSDALRIAALSPRVLTALHDQMKKHALVLEN